MVGVSAICSRGWVGNKAVRKVRSMPVEVCKLCLETKPLVRTHLISGGIYALCRDDKGEHIFLGSRTVLHSSRELKDYLLCKECDNSLNRSGESWLLPKLARQDGTFPLLDILEQQGPLTTKGGALVYRASENPEIKIEKAAEEKIEEAKEIIETAKEIEKIPEAKIEEKRFSMRTSSNNSSRKTLSFSSHFFLSPRSK
jgi:hypothetical protein